LHDLQIGSAGAVYPFCKLCKKKIRNRKSVIIQQNNVLDQKVMKLQL